MAQNRVLVETHEACLAHDTGPGHPERPLRMAAVRRGIEASRLEERVLEVSPEPACRRDLERAHDSDYLDSLEEACKEGGGALDADTVVSPGSWRASLMAAGAGLDAIERLRRGEAEAAFIAVRPPGHHALAHQAMGFCMINNVAVAAASLAEAGERVMIVDFDAHHGNGTQDTFAEDDRVTYLSLHEWPLYPGTGWWDEIGRGRGEGATINVPLPHGCTGDVYIQAMEDLVEPVAARVRPTRLLVSAGFDGHRADPLTGLALSAGDYWSITARLSALVPPSRVVAFLEGGYDLAALASSTASCLSALAGEKLLPEPVTSGGPGTEMVQLVRQRLPRSAWPLG